MSKLKPRGFVFEMGLHPLVSETASQFLNSIAPLGTQPADVPFQKLLKSAITINTERIYQSLGFYY